MGGFEASEGRFVIIDASYDETGVWQEFGEMKFASKDDIPPAWGNPDPAKPRWVPTRYVEWTSWLAGAQQWGLSSMRQGENSGTIDRFPPRHARKVLAAFGRAFGNLPDESQPLHATQKAFLAQAVEELTEDGHVVCVRLALFAEMLKGKPWEPSTLQRTGGTEGVGVTFLEDEGFERLLPIALTSVVFGLGGVQNEPVVRGNEIVKARVMKCTLMVDNFVISGPVGLRVGKDFRQLLEDGSFVTAEMRQTATPRARSAASVLSRTARSASRSTLLSATSSVRSSSEGS